LKIKIILFLVVGIAIILSASCQKKTTEDQANCDKPVMYNTSELAELMRNMYADNEEIKERIMKGEWPDSFPSYFAQLHTAKATDPSDINDTYKGLADEYLHRFDELKNTTKENRVTSYNALVNGCLSCHQVFCSGPVPKIKKLLITQ
jgi:hypothetical protein